MEVSIYILSFVENINLFVNNFKDLTTSAQILVQKLKQDTMLFKDLLLSSGGKLEPNKCNYSVLAWDYDEEGFPKVNVKHFEPMEITDSENKTIAEIKYALLQ